MQFAVQQNNLSEEVIWSLPYSQSLFAWWIHHRMKRFLCGLTEANGLDVYTLVRQVGSMRPYIYPKKLLDILESSASRLSALCLEIYCRDLSCHVNINSFEFLWSLDVQTQAAPQSFMEGVFILFIYLLFIGSIRCTVCSLQYYSSSVWVTNKKSYFKKG